MIFLVTLVVAVLAFLIHLTGWGPFDALVSVPVTALVAVCVVGAAGRLSPKIRHGMAKIVPKVFPAKQALVLIAGGLELLGAIGLVIPATRLAAAICLALFFVAVFPANVRHAHLQGDADGSYARKVTIRGAEQVVFIALCVWVIVAEVG